MINKKYDITFSFGNQQSKYVSVISSKLEKKLDTHMINFEIFYSKSYKMDFNNYLNYISLSDSLLTAVFVTDYSSDPDFFMLQQQLIKYLKSESIPCIIFISEPLYLEGILSPDEAVIIGEKSPDEISDIIIDKINSYKESKASTDESEIYNNETELIGNTRDILKPDIAPDSIGSEDLLNRKNEIESFALLLASSDLTPPLSIGIFGNWGSGKSFFMNKIYERIKEISEKAKIDNEPDFCENILQIKFNAWHYMDTNLFASLVGHIFEELSEFVGNIPKDEQKKLELYNNLSTIKKIKEDAKEKVKCVEENIKSINEAIFYNKLSIISVNVFDEIFHGKAWDIIKEKIKTTPAIYKTLDKISNFPLRKSKKSKLELNMIKILLKPVPVVSISIFIIFGAIAGVLIFLLLNNNTFNSNNKIFSNLSRYFSIAVSFCSLITGSIFTFVKKIRFDEVKKIFNEKIKPIIEKFNKKLKGNKKNLQDNKSILEMEAEITKLEEIKKEQKENLVKMQVKEKEIQNQINTINSSKLLHNFISERLSSNDYHRHLGIISLIRKDFEKLNDFLYEIPGEIDFTRFTDIYNESDNNEKKILKENYNINIPKLLKKHEYNEITKKLNILNKNQDETKQKNKLKILELLKNAYEESKNGKYFILKNNLAANEKEKLIHFFINQGFLYEKKYIKNTKIPDDVKDLIQKILGKKQIRIERIVLYIDDLDRCPANKVIEVLQAIHLFLAFPLFVVIVGVDPRWITKSLLKRYDLMLTCDEDINNSGFKEELKGSATPYDYLEKIFQIPYKLKPIYNVEKKQFIEELVKNVSAKFDNNEMQDYIKNTIKDSTDNKVKNEIIKTSIIEKEKTGNIINKNNQYKINEVYIEEQNIILKSVKIESYELKFLKVLSPIIGHSPRSIKRLINIYKLIKSNDRWFGINDNESYKPILILLAVITGCPSFSLYFFEYLFRETKSKNITFNNYINHFKNNKSSSADKYYTKDFLENTNAIEEFKTLYNFLYSTIVKDTSQPEHEYEEELIIHKEINDFDINIIKEKAQIVSSFSFREYKIYDLLNDV